MAPPSEKDLIDDTVQEFSSALQSAMPLRHFSEFHDDMKIADVAQPLGQKFVAKFMKTKTGFALSKMCDLAKELGLRIEGEIEQWAAMNRDHRALSELFLKKWTDMLCEQLKTSLEAQLLLNPGTDLDVLKKLVETEMVTVIKCFEERWKPGDDKFKEDHKLKLEQQLDIMGKEIQEEHTRRLEIKSLEKAKKLLGEVKAIVFEKFRLLKSDIDSFEGQVYSQMVKEKLEDMIKFLRGKGKGLSEKYPKIYSQLMETLSSEMKFLNEGGQDLSAENAASWSEGLDLKLQFALSQNEKVDRMNLEENGIDVSSVEERSTASCANVTSEQEPEHNLLGMNELKHQIETVNAPTPTSLSDPSHNDDGNKKNEERKLRRSGRFVAEHQHLLENITVLGGADCPMYRCNVCQKEFGMKPLLKFHGIFCEERKKPFKCEQCDRLFTAKKYLTQHVRVHSRRISNEALVEGSCSTNREQEIHVSFKDAIVNSGKHWESQIMAYMSPSSPSPSSTKSSGPNDQNEDPGLRSESKQKNNNQEIDIARSSPLQQDKESATDKENGRNECDEPVLKKQRKNGVVIPNYITITILNGEPCKYRCNFCQREFKNKYRMRFHKLCWQGEDPFKCHHCGKGFLSKSSLSKHLILHTRKQNEKEKLYKCSECKQSFTSCFKLRHHAANKHTWKSPYSCNRCKKALWSKQALRDHMHVHTGERPYKCPICGFGFRQLANLPRHIKDVHKKSREVARRLARSAINKCSNRKKMA